MPEIVTDWLAATLTVVTVKLALVEPAGTVTLDGTVATAVLPLDSETTAPPAGAAPLRVTVPCEAFPPTTLVGFRVNDDSVTAVAGVTVSVALFVVPFNVPEIVTD